jgi:TonB family protein
MVMKMGDKATLLSLSLILLAPQAAANEAPLELEPSSSWNVHYADDYCRLARTFGTGDDALILFMDRFGPGDYFRMTLAGEITKAKKNGGEAAVRFGPPFAEHRLVFFSGWIDEKIPAWIFIADNRIRPLSLKEQKRTNAAFKAGLGAAHVEVSPITAEDEAATTYVEFGRPLRRPVRLMTGSLKAPFDALRSCLDNLITHWGLDPDRLKNQSKGVSPIGNPGKWLTHSDYPSAMLSQGMPGIVNFRLIVDEKGVPASCHVQQSTNPEGFDKAVCNALMRRARFDPAVDASGNPMRSYYLNKVRFHAP